MTQCVLRFLLTAALIYWAVYGESKLAMVVLLSLMSAAHEAAAYVVLRKR